MAIAIRNANQMRTLIHTLASDFVDANIAFRLNRDLIDASEQYNQELHQSWTFWTLTVQAHLDAAIFHICRLFDQKPNVLGLRGFLETVRANLHLFTPERFRERLADRQGAEELRANPPLLVREALDRDIAYAKRDSNERVDRLIDVRHNYYVHRNAARVLGAVLVSDEDLLTIEDIGELLRGGMEIVNRYSNVFNANTYSVQMVGRDDYEYVLEAIREKLQQYRAQIAEQCRAAGVEPPEV